MMTLDSRRPRLQCKPCRLREGMVVAYHKSVLEFHSLVEIAYGLPSILVVGHEWRTAEDYYDWDCRRRPNPHLVFQYTVSGEGEIEVDGSWHRLPAGRAFLIEIPGGYHYRLPSDSPHWELRYIGLSNDCLGWWTNVVAGVGRLVDLSPTHPVVRKLVSLTDRAMSGEVTDAFHNSSMAYEFLMELYRLRHPRPWESQLPEPVQRAVHFIHSQLEAPIGVADIAASAGISKFHAIRLFREHLGESPTRYLSKLRIRRAAGLLVETDLTIEEVARHSGYLNGNYFAKAFRKWMGVTPTAFRTDAHLRGVDKVQVHS